MVNPKYRPSGNCGKPNCNKCRPSVECCEPRCEPICEPICEAPVVPQKVCLLLPEPTCDCGIKSFFIVGGICMDQWAAMPLVSLEARGGTWHFPGEIGPFSFWFIVDCQNNLFILMPECTVAFGPGTPVRISILLG